jgi:hypothetical protein
MAGQYGVKETLEVWKCAKAAIFAIVREAKRDGFQPTDMAAFLKSPEFEAAVSPALQGVEQVPAELGELDIFDDLALARTVYGLG